MLYLPNKTDNLQFVALTGYRKLYKNNQQAGGLITRLPAIFYACKRHFHRVFNAPPFILQKYDIKWICKFADMRYNRYIEFNKSEFVRNRNFEVY